MRSRPGKSAADASWGVPKIRFEAAEHNELSQQAYGMLLQWIPFADRHYTEWDQIPNCGYFFG